MNIKDKIEWLQQECKELGLTLSLEGECGLGRSCVGVLFVKGEDSFYPDYQVTDEDGYIIYGAEVWTPKDAYHKHPCVAVLGHGDDSISQLYDWMKWFKDNKYFLNIVKKDLSSIEDPIVRMFTNEWSACFMPQEWFFQGAK